MKSKYDQIIQTERGFEFRISHCNNSDEALKVAEMITKKFKSKGKEKYEGVFESLESMKKYGGLI